MQALWALLGIAALLGAIYAWDRLTFRRYTRKRAELGREFARGVQWERDHAHDVPLTADESAQLDREWAEHIYGPDAEQAPERKKSS